MRFDRYENTSQLHVHKYLPQSKLPNRFFWIKIKSSAAAKFLPPSAPHLKSFRSLHPPTTQPPSSHPSTHLLSFVSLSAIFFLKTVKDVQKSKKENEKKREKVGKLSGERKREESKWDKKGTKSTRRSQEGRRWWWWWWWWGGLEESCEGNERKGKLIWEDAKRIASTALKS